MSTSHDLETLIEPVLTPMGYELVGIEFRQYGNSGLLRIFIDKPDGIQINDCERVSHQVSGLLDVEDPIRGAYRLEVSSPGMDRPLFKRAHYERFIGETVNVKTRAPVEGRKKFKGVLKTLNDDVIVVNVDGKDFNVPWESIDRTNLVPKF